MARGMVLGNGVPTPMLDRDSCGVAGRLKPHLDSGDLSGRECRMPPSKGEADTWLPDRNAANLELLAIRECLGKAATGTWLEGKHSRLARCKPEKGIGTPPKANVAGENLECPLRRGGDA